MKSVAAAKSKKQPKREKSESAAEQPARVEKNWLEWSVFGISLVLVVTMVGYLLYLEFIPSKKDFKYAVTFGESRQLDGRFLVPVKVKNESNQSAKDVMIEISAGNEAGDKAELQLDYLPRHSIRKGVVYFENAPVKLEGHVNSINLPY